MGELLRLAAGLDTQVKELTVAQRPVIGGLANEWIGYMPTVRAGMT